MSKISKGWMELTLNLMGKDLTVNMREESTKTIRGSRIIFSGIYKTESVKVIITKSKIKLHNKIKVPIECRDYQIYQMTFQGKNKLRSKTIS